MSRGYNLGAIMEPAIHGRAGRSFGRTSHSRTGRVGGEVKADIIVCTGDSSSPPLFVPSEAPKSDIVFIDDDMRKALNAARGARNPREMQNLRARAEELTSAEEEALASMLARKKTLTDAEKARLKLLSARKKGLTPKQVQQMAALEIKTRTIATAQDRVAALLSRPGAVVPTNKQKTSWISGGAMSVQDSGNEKISGARQTSTTYASIQHTCPTSCMQRGVSCYAETSNNIRPLVLMLEHIANTIGHDDHKGIMVAEDEARTIDAMFSLGIKSPTDLRIHTVGDARTPEAVRTLASAASRWMSRAMWRASESVAPAAAWSYTHGWFMHSRDHWGPVSTLASVQAPAELSRALRSGWAPTIVVPGHFFEKPYTDCETGEKKEFWDAQGMPIPFKVCGTDVNWIACPAQNPDERFAPGCVSCRLCFDDQKLRKMNAGIAFQAHASGKIRGVPFKAAEYAVEHANAMEVRKRRLAVL